MWRKFIDKFTSRFDSRLTKWEEKGFQTANKFHRYAINGCLLFIAYQLYSFLSAYNDFFLQARKIKKI